MEPFDVMEAGRMAAVADPTGGVVNLWTPKTLIGAELVNEHGSMSWNELVTPDVATAVAFFAEVIGWTTQTMAGPGADYTVFMAGERGIAGTVPPQQEGIPPHWDVYFAVDDSDKAVGLDKRARRVGPGRAVRTRPASVASPSCATRRASPSV